MRILILMLICFTILGCTRTFSNLHEIRLECDDYYSRSKEHVSQFLISPYSRIEDMAIQINSVGNPILISELKQHGEVLFEKEIQLKEGKFNLTIPYKIQVRKNNELEIKFTCANCDFPVGGGGELPPMISFFIYTTSDSDPDDFYQNEYENKSNEKILMRLRGS